MERITTDRGLQPGDEIECSACGLVHVLRPQSTAVTARGAAKVRLYVSCETKKYFVGRINEPCTRGTILTRPSEASV